MYTTENECKRLIENAVGKWWASWNYKHEPKLTKQFDKRFKAVEVTKKGDI